ncbi:MAG: phosphotransferase-like protein, partial [Candidatus Heimdallarchaeaceae archaeon]
MSTQRINIYPYYLFFNGSLDMDKGIIILLNGASSSGKSMIANSLQETMDEPYLIIGLDKFFQLYSDAFTTRFNPPPIPKDISPDEGYALR